MKVDVQNKQLFVFCENDAEKEKMYKFLKKLEQTRLGIGVGTLEITNSEKIGLYLEALDETIRT